ncbi:uncharacterized protein A4U43_C02F17110 [Asparagus officinalis]|uniref:Uncharacterized protein n=1 Tax=Asparagus officinalis TaxID=4686 RepID=A0A5P1FKQ8_ASPOF|nr:uncharacterized protein LOC109831563 [Asparagus officinalis]ONK78313.1 uncharacterized protein A4U43_C02F17110 [Asparagus officinalis]
MASNPNPSISIVIGVDKSDKSSTGEEHRDGNREEISLSSPNGDDSVERSEVEQYKGLKDQRLGMEGNGEGISILEASDLSKEEAKANNGDPKEKAEIEEMGKLEGVECGDSTEKSDVVENSGFENQNVVKRRIREEIPLSSVNGDDSKELRNAVGQKFEAEKDRRLESEVNEEGICVSMDVESRDRNQVVPFPDTVSFNANANIEEEMENSGDLMEKCVGNFEDVVEPKDIESDGDSVSKDTIVVREEKEHEMGVDGHSKETDIQNSEFEDPNIVKKKRGRPPKNKSHLTNQTPVKALIPLDSNVDSVKKRGRPREKIKEEYVLAIPTPIGTRLSSRRRLRDISKDFALDSAGMNERHKKKIAKEVCSVNEGDFQVQNISSKLKESSYLNEMLSKLILLAADPYEEFNSLPMIISFFTDFRDFCSTIASEDHEPEKPIGKKRGRKKKTVSFDLDPDYTQDSGTKTAVSRGQKRKNPSQDNGQKEKIQKVNCAEEIKEESPTALILTFEDPDALPSERYLNKVFSHYGPLIKEETDILRKSNRALVVFKYSIDAQSALRNAGKVRVFGPALHSYRLRELLPKSSPATIQDQEGNQEGNGVAIDNE